MESSELAITREALGLTRDQLAAELGLAPHVIEAWEAGRVRVPKRFISELRWRRAAAEREQALAVSGLPECETDKAWADAPVPSGLEANTKHLEAGIAHRLSCPTCKAREEYVKERFGPMPAPSMPTWMVAFGWFDDRITKLPKWGRPAAWVGLAFGAYSLVRVAFMLPRLSANPQYWSVALGGLAASVAIGIAVGLAYGVFRELKKRFQDSRAA